MGKRALIVHSKSTYEYAKKVAKAYEDVKFLLVKSPPTSAIGYWEKDAPTIIGIGGGSVIDTAKIMANPRRCIAIPTTASGAAMTPYATVWQGFDKKSIQCPIPIIQKYTDEIALPINVAVNTWAEAKSHAVESFWSNNATSESIKYTKKALQLMLFGISAEELIKAGNYAGKAIAITKTNIIHAMSYPLTTVYGISHGRACCLLFNYIVKLMGYPSLAEHMFTSKTKFKIDAKRLAKMAMKYPKIHDTHKKITEKDLIKIYKKL
jgi:alcohol dehydrogenase class IV